MCSRRCAKICSEDVNPPRPFGAGSQIFLLNLREEAGIRLRNIEFAMEYVVDLRKLFVRGRQFDENGQQVFRLALGLRLLLDARSQVELEEIVVDDQRKN